MELKKCQWLYKLHIIVLHYTSAVSHCIALGCY